MASRIQPDTRTPTKTECGGCIGGSVCPARTLRATFIMTFPDSVPKFTITQ